MLLTSEHAAEHQLTDSAVLGALSLVLGRTAGAVARNREQDFERVLDFLVRHVRQAAVGEFARRSYAIH